MNYEEKYKEVFKRAEAIIRFYKNQNRDDETSIKDLELIFPELKESEDEKVEKAIFGMVYDSDNELWSSYDVTKSDVLAWLEKQGEQKSFDDLVKEITKNKETATSFLKSCGIMNANGELADEYKIEQNEQKPVWSKEDEVKDNWEYIQDFIEKLGHFPKDSDELDVLINYVLSKTEWSEEDSSYYDDICEILINFLHSEKANVNKEAI